MAKNDTLSADYVRSRLSYDPETGLLYWKEKATGKSSDKQFNKLFAGNAAGHLKPDGYIVLFLDRKARFAHRLAFLIMTGHYPVDEVDHINGDQSDNRWVNLREATHAQNGKNQRMQCDNTSGFKGVTKASYGWRATIISNGVRYNLGTFRDPETASLAYQQAAAAKFGTFARA